MLWPNKANRGGIRKLNTSKGLIIICFSLLLNFISSPAWAVDFPFINKSKIRLSVTPGQSKYGEILIENPTAEEKSMRVYLEDWYYLPAADGSKDFLPANSLPSSCASWITFSPAELTVSPYGRQRLNYTVKVPSGAKGTHFAVLFFETQMGMPGVAENGVGAGINLAVRTAALFYVQAEGTIKKSAEFGNITLKKDSATKNLLINLDFKNTGNVDITLKGSYHIMDKDGNIYARGELNDIFTFPGDSAKLGASWKEPLSQGQYTLVVTSDLGKAEEDAGLSRGPVVIKEADFEVGADSEIAKVGELK